MQPREPKPQGPKVNPEPPEVEGGEKDQAAPQPAPELPGGMIGEGGPSGASGEGDREGGMLSQG